MIKVIKSDGTEKILKEKLSLELLQREVGGYIELVHARVMPDDERTQIFVNEEARFKNLPVNAKVSMIVGERILGDVVVLTAPDLSE